MITYKNEELDLLIFFYLQECGYLHSAFTLSNECGVNFFEQLSYKIPPGLLISFFQRGLLYTEMEIGFPLPNFGNFRSPILDFLRQKKKDIISDCNFSETFRDSAAFTISHQYTIQVCIWHPRKFFIYLGSNNSKIYKWNVFEKKTRKNKLKNQVILNSINNLYEECDANETNNIDCNLNGTLFVSSNFRGGIFFWAETGKLLKKYFIKSSSINDLKWSQNSRYIAIGCVNRKIILFSSWFMQKLVVISVPSADFSNIKWISNTNILFLSSHNKICFVKTIEERICEILIHSSKICSVEIYTAKNLIASCSKNGKIKIWIYQCNLKLVYEIRAHKKEISVIKWKPKNLSSDFSSNKINENIILLSTSIDCSIKIWSIQKKKCIFIFYQKKPVLSSAWNLFENKLIVGLPGGIIIFINCKKKKYTEKNLGKNFYYDVYCHSMSIIFLLISSKKLACV